MSWFEVDKEGLARLLERRGKVFALYELVANVWDTSATRVDVTMVPMPGEPYVRVSVEDDDPTGFVRLDDSFTLFADSQRKGDVEKRGRFNLGEKLVLALCRRAAIESTTGTVVFEEGGRREGRRRRSFGSVFSGEMRMTRQELEEVRGGLRRLLPPRECVTMVDGERLLAGDVVRDFMALLPTELGDSEGVLRRKELRAQVTLHERRGGEAAMLYEMGIPIAEIGGHQGGQDPWHVNVHQKIPLGFDRDAPTPGYVRRVRAEVLNAAHDLLPLAPGGTAWLEDAASDQRAGKEGVSAALDVRFGTRRVIADPSDPEGTKIAFSSGYAVIHGGALTSAEWDNVRWHGAALPAGQVTPSPKPYVEGGRAERVVPEADWTVEQSRVVRFVERLSRSLIGADVDVRIVREPSVSWGATFGKLGSGGRMALNLSRLGLAWFSSSNMEEILRLVIHELGHYYSCDHLSSDYHEALCRLGARLAAMVAREGSEVIEL